MTDIGIIGLGKLGGAIAHGLHRARPGRRIFGTRRSTAQIPAFVTPYESNAQLVERVPLVLVCVKPQQIGGVLEEIAPVLGPQHRLVSTCAGVTIARLSAAVPFDVRIARAMPNIACEYNEGITALACDPRWDETSRDEVLTLFAELGEAVALEECHFDAVTALSGCGPAYVCVMAEALSDAGVKAGLPRGVARMMAVQTLLGSAVLLRSLDEHPAVIRDRVATPGGCTVEALAQLEEGRLRATLISAVSAAAAKSALLASERPPAHIPPCAVE